MKWRDRVSANYAKLPPGLETRPAFRAHASSAQIAELESTIGGLLPLALSELLLESNGIMAELRTQGEWTGKQASSQIVSRSLNKRRGGTLGPNFLTAPTARDRPGVRTS